MLICQLHKYCSHASNIVDFPSITSAICKMRNNECLNMNGWLTVYYKLSQRESAYGICCIKYIGDFAHNSAHSSSLRKMDFIN